MRTYQPKGGNSEDGSIGAGLGCAWGATPVAGAPFNGLLETLALGVLAPTPPVDGHAGVDDVASNGEGCACRKSHRVLEGFGNLIDECRRLVSE